MIHERLRHILRPIMAAISDYVALHNKLFRPCFQTFSNGAANAERDNDIPGRSQCHVGGLLRADDATAEPPRAAGFAWRRRHLLQWRWLEPWKPLRLHVKRRLGPCDG